MELYGQYATAHTRRRTRTPHGAAREHHRPRRTPGGDATRDHRAPQDRARAVTSSLYCLSCVYLEHLNPLRALSETCKRLRSVFLEQAWRRLEACASTRVSDAYENRHYSYAGMNTVSSTNVEKEVAKALVRKAEVVTIRNPDLAQYVRIVTVTLVDGAQRPCTRSLRGACSCSRIWRRSKFCGFRTAYTTGGGAYRAPFPTRSRAAYFQPCALSCSLRTFTCKPIAADSVHKIVDLLPHLMEIPPVSTESLPPEILGLLMPMKNLRCITLADTQPARKTNGFLRKPSTG